MWCQYSWTRLWIWCCCTQKCDQSVDNSINKSHFEPKSIKWMTDQPMKLVFQRFKTLETWTWNYRITSKKSSYNDWSANMCYGGKKRLPLQKTKDGKNAHYLDIESGYYNTWLSRNCHARGGRYQRYERSKRVQQKIRNWKEVLPDILSFVIMATGNETYIKAKIISNLRRIMTIRSRMVNSASGWTYWRIWKTYFL